MQEETVLVVVTCLEVVVDATPAVVATVVIGILECCRHEWGVVVACIITPLLVATEHLPVETGTQESAEVMVAELLLPIQAGVTLNGVLLGGQRTDHVVMICTDVADIESRHTGVWQVVFIVGIDQRITELRCQVEVLAELIRRSDGDVHQRVLEVVLHLVLGILVECPRVTQLIVVVRNGRNETHGLVQIGLVLDIEIGLAQLTVAIREWRDEWRFGIGQERGCRRSTLIVRQWGTIVAKVTFDVAE